MSERDDYIAGRLMDRDDEREHRQAWEAQHAEDHALDEPRPSPDEMRARFAAERREVESAWAEAFDRHREHHPSSARPRYPLDIVSEP